MKPRSIHKRWRECDDLILLDPVVREIDEIFVTAIHKAVHNYGKWFHSENDIRTWILHCFVNALNLKTDIIGAIDIFTDSRKYDNLDIVVTCFTHEVIACQLKYYWDQWNNQSFLYDIFTKLERRSQASLKYFVCAVKNVDLIPIGRFNVKGIRGIFFAWDEGKRQWKEVKFLYANDRTEKRATNVTDTRPDLSS